MVEGWFNSTQPTTLIADVKRKVEEMREMTENDDICLINYEMPNTNTWMSGSKTYTTMQKEERR